MARTLRTDMAAVRTAAARYFRSHNWRETTGPILAILAAVAATPLLIAALGVAIIAVTTH